MEKLKSWFKHHASTAALIIGGLLLFFIVAGALGINENDQSARIAWDQFLYPVIGYVILGMGVAVTWFIFQTFFPTINQWINSGGFREAWSECSPEVKICVTVFIVGWLLFCVLFSLHP